MAASIERGIEIKTVSDVSEIRDVAEQQFACLLLKLNPHLKIVHEPGPFRHRNGNGEMEETLPDFLIVNPKRLDPTEIFIEITTASREGKDPKARQKRAMRGAAPNVRYTVLYHHNLEKIQTVYPEFDFFNGKKLRRGEG